MAVAVMCAHPTTDHSVVRTLLLKSHVSLALWNLLPRL